MEHQTRTFSGYSGLSLQADTFGDEAGLPVILAHGGGQTRHAWRGAGEALAGAGYYSICLDLRGHGASAWCPEGDYRIEDFAQDLLSVCETFDTRPVLVGASLGGIAAMVAAGEIDPLVFRSVVFVDVTPHMEMNGVDKILGFMREHLDEGFGSLQEAADAISGYLPQRPKPRDLSGLEKNLREIDGRYFWHWDPKFVTGVNRPSASRDPERLAKAVGNINAPILLVRGRMSELVSQECVDKFLELVPHAEFVDVVDAGHMVAGDRNDVFNEAVVGFLSG
ncbi:MAG: alpha/beta hydrolase [Gammaproteobacteria bacterium]|nr:alpha/beta hydrolase [Gammaproteobacteria bacterium]